MKLTTASNHLQSLWRLRADETRSLAEQVSDPQAKRVVLEIALRCERLAELVVLLETAGLEQSSSSLARAIPA